MSNHSNKEVAKVNYSMHEAHCKRFLCLCPDCGDSVPKEQLEEHREEQHTVVRCQKCDEKMQRCKLPDHEKDECSERPQSCEFCNLELPLSALNEHTETCGSRTERCPDCKQYVMLKDRTRHDQICSSALSKDDGSNNDDSIYEDRSVPADNLQDDQKFGGYLSYNQSGLYVDLSQAGVSEEPEEPPDLNFSFLTQQKKDSGAAGFGDWDQISTCPHCHLALPLRTLEWHEKKCKIFEILKLIT
ncbi:XIAP-associated factor 1 isoform X2 [Colossoma macropomum]|uniref:XIAP-associated factor 1 isoform X2 n=1 Tax=Colossoma macropomum TaxID=42526 RepID=UPI001864EF07|nr:XIAP-associated factor 1 isoform X2 [Colossoma macropomum]